MVKTKLIIVTFASIFLASSCSTQVEWKKYVVDGHRTNVTSPNSDNIKEALGTIDDEYYTTPNGRKYSSGTATYLTAEAMIEAQSVIAPLKKVIAHSSMEMIKDGANCELCQWVVDNVAMGVESMMGKKVDVALFNTGGIRVDMPKGDVILEDLLSMFPFDNYLCYLELKGSDLLALFESMAHKPQPFSGAKMVVKDGKLKSLTVGGETVNHSKVYRLATIDFLLDGGDGVFAARNAQKLIISKIKVVDLMLERVKDYAQRGESIAYHIDDRLVFEQ